MHPNISLHKNKDCTEAIMALHHCHETKNKLNLFECNEVKKQLLECLGEQYKKVQRENASKGKEARLKREALWKDLEE